MIATTMLSPSAEQAALLQMTDFLKKEQIDELIAQAAKLNFGNVSKNFGNYFTKLIGHREISKIPKASQNLDKTVLEILKKAFKNDYPAPPLPSQMGNNNILKGEFEGRSFIILKLEVIDEKTGKIKEIATEIVFQRYSSDDMTYNYVTSHKATDPKDKDHNPQYTESLLHSSDRLLDHQMIAVKNLIEGRTIASPLKGNDNILLRLAKQIPVTEKDKPESKEHEPSTPAPAAVPAESEWVEV